MKRFDLATLAAPELLSPPTPAEQARLAPWRAWCLADAAPFSVATALDDAAHARLATLLCLDLDGSWRLQQGSRLGGLALRARTLLNDACWWRARQDGDPWDCGWLREDAAGLAALARFQPRRATLIVARQRPPSWQPPRGRHPLRLLVLSSTVEGTALPLD